MGMVFSFYRRKETPLQILESLEEEIQSLEDTRQTTQQRQQKIVGRLIIYSVLLYIIAATLFYFCFFPASLQERIIYIAPLLIFPVIVVLLKRLLTWHYRRSIISSKDKLADLRAKKKKILDEVMDKETFKVAKDILEKFAPDQLGKTLNQGKESLQLKTKPELKPVPKVLTVASVQAPNAHQPTLSPAPFSVQPMHAQQPNTQQQSVRPILHPNRGLMDKLIEALVGDGPNNRYALICRNCATHNGMALKEEFEYIAFRCVYCGFPNAARKQRPRGPPLLAICDPEREVISDQESHSGGQGVVITEVTENSVEEVEVTDERTDEILGCKVETEEKEGIIEELPELGSLLGGPENKKDK